MATLPRCRVASFPSTDEDLSLFGSPILTSTDKGPRGRQTFWLEVSQPRPLKRRQQREAERPPANACILDAPIWQLDGRCGSYPLFSPLNHLGRSHSHRHPAHKGIRVVRLPSLAPSSVATEDEDEAIADALVPRPSLRREQDSSASGASFSSMTTDASSATAFSIADMIVPTSPKQASSPALSADHSSVRASPPIATPPSLPPPPAITFPAPPSLKKVKATANRTKLIILPEDYDRSGSGKTSCHVCRTRSNRYKMTCTTEGCIKRFCGPCMRTRHAHIDGFRPADFEFTPNASFLCPFCRGNCQCSVCSERRIRSAAGIPTISIRKKIARSDRADSFELGRDSDSRPPPKKRPKPRAVKSMSIDAEGGDSGMSSSGERGGLPMPWAMPPVPLPVARPVYALDKIHLKLHLGPVAKAKEEEEEGYASTASSGSDDSAPVNPLAAQRRLVRKLGVSTAPRRLSSCPQDLAPHHVPPPGVPTGLEYEPFDDLFLGPSPAPTAHPMLISPGFPLPLLTPRHEHHVHLQTPEAWIAYNLPPHSLGAQSYLEP